VLLLDSANGYYSPIAYFLSKVLFDIVPLRIVPSVILGCIVYGLVGLVPNLVEFWKFLLILVLFNLAAASVVLFLSVAIANNGVASLCGSLVMLYKCVSTCCRQPFQHLLALLLTLLLFHFLSLLFAGLLMNYNQSSLVVRVLMNFSFFHAAFEGLLVNELRTTQLKDHKVRF
jgi:ABC-type multidrug transport system permease subunit